MPYIINGKIYKRCTEIIFSDTCPFPAWLYKNVPIDKIILRNNFVTIPGTMVHREIEKLIPTTDSTLKEKIKAIGLKENYDMESDGSPDFIEQFYLENIVDNYYLRDVIDNVIESRTNAFFDFLLDFSPEIIFTELTFKSDKLGVAGTVDSFLKVKITEENYNKVIDGTLKPGDTAYIICDFKSSKQSQKGHGVQLTIYGMMMKEMGVFEVLEPNIPVKQWCLVLGGESKRKKTKYTLKEYDPEDEEIQAKIQTAFHYSNHPEPVTQYGMHCTFCSVVYHCPRNTFYQLETEQILEKEIPCHQQHPN